MKKILLHCFIGVFCLAMTTGCTKEAKRPYGKTTTADKATVSPVTQPTPTQDQSNHTCGSQSGSYGSQSGSHSGS